MENLEKEYDNFRDFMNKPESPDGQAYISCDKKGIKWVSCPWCGKRQFELSEGAIIRNQRFKCKASLYKKEFMVNLEG